MPRLLITALLVAASALAGWGGQIPPPSGSALPEAPVTDEDREHWAFVPPHRPAVPKIERAGWVRNSIDAFILAELEKNGLHPAPEADRVTLLRRLSFGLTGLPPTAEELDAFLSDTSRDAYEKQVDRLLDSPQYGVRWAQRWLDLARYADTDGFDPDRARPYAWRYRDWVSFALNHDMPYDEFIRLQLAGDEIRPGDPLAFIATGFIRACPEMSNIGDQELRRQAALSDVTETTGLVFLGLTIGCARCHDHKTDPIRQADFYRLQAFFAAMRFRNSNPIATAVQIAGHERQTQAWERRVAEIQTAIIRLESPIRDSLAPGPPPGAKRNIVEVYQKTASKRSPTEVAMVFEATRKDPRLDQLKLEASLGPELTAARAELLARLDSVRKAKPLPLPHARGVNEDGAEAPPTHLLKRGNPREKGPEVKPGVPAVLCKSNAEASPTIAAIPGSTGRRKALADWLTRPDNPLTARVIVNRLWQEHFGRGIVGTSSDFGVMGDSPTHPELHDWLATELVARGWSLKAMHRLMVTSATYRQSTAAEQARYESDPDNTLLWRQNRRRLDAEAIRDALLTSSGLLNPKRGGPGVASEPMRNSTVKPEDRYRRSLYLFVRRSGRDPFLEVYDRPDANASCPRRTVTTTATQALALLNGSLAHDCAQALAGRIVRQVGDDRAAAIDLAYRLTLSRPPDDDERRLSTKFLEESPLVDLCLGLFNINEFVYVD